ncbi:MAG: hypothetical protein KAV45_08575 [Calditrichia bacterium]|nr:hypothetical protein [Calditrichia bacterium]MCK4813400.1 hypothetical protein [Candidatus Neomarinimicrobiota bacterium]
MDINTHNIEELEAQIKSYQDERERIRQLIGQIGSTSDIKRDKKINWIFITLIFLLFAFDIMRHVFGLNNIPLPPLFSIEIGIFLVSIKIIWMISRQSKIDHFQFWILNSIEFRINNLSRQLNELQDIIEDLDKVNVAKK